ncbi:MAG: hypothetical protein JNK61_00020 [Bacteroidia bacterium]|nr:hypothetical protein [Bacteroidia bacterium]
MKTTLTLTACLLFSNLFAQVTLTVGSDAKTNLIKESTPYCFQTTSYSYFVTKYFKSAEMHYNATVFDKNGLTVFDDEIKIPGGVFNNTYGIDDIVVLGNEAFALVEHLDKAAGANTLTARKFESAGKVATAETALMKIPFEKIMNSGYNYAAVSPDNKTMAIVGEMPFNKEQPCILKINLFDASLKNLHTQEITLPGENKKNKAFEVLVNNNGLVYIIKRSTTKNGEIALTAYACDVTKNNTVKEFVIELAAPEYILSYKNGVADNGQLVVAGLSYKRATISANETKTTGTFYFTNTGFEKPEMMVVPLTTPIDNLTARKLIFNGNTTFLAAEQYKAERETQPPGTTGFDYNYNYTHKNDYIIGFDNTGNRKFEMPLMKDFKARNFDLQHYANYFVVNNKLTVFYNDETKKYIQNDYTYGYLLPTIVQITNDGLMQSPVVLRDKIRLPQQQILYPVYGVQTSGNQINMLMINSNFMQLLTTKIE